MEDKILKSDLIAFKKLFIEVKLTLLLVLISFV